MSIVYYLNKPIYLVTDLALKAIPGSQLYAFDILQQSESQSIGAIKNRLEHDEVPGLICVLKDEINEDEFFKEAIPIAAAGGVVEAPGHQMLFIERLGKWDLPKGKIESGEDILKAAMREIEEETGVRNLQLASKLCCTYHLYEQKKKTFLKTTHWFHFNIQNIQPIRPQQEEGITAVHWLHKDALNTIYQNTYKTIEVVLSCL